MVKLNAQPKILVVDDDRGPRESLRMALKVDYDVMASETVDDAMAYLDETSVELVILDIRMTGRDGFDALREIRSRDAELSVIMLSGVGTKETVQQSLTLGANAYIDKPFDVTELRKLVRKYVERTLSCRRRQKAEHELRQINTQLESQLADSTHLAEMGHLSAEFAHDLRNPLAVIHGYVNLLGSRLRDAGDLLGDETLPTDRCLGLIESNIARCQEMVDMWQGLGRRKLRRTENVAIHELLELIADGIRAQEAQRGKRIEVSMDLRPGNLIGDSLQLSRAFNNVVDNAMHALPEVGGCIEISCAPVNGSIRVQVKDNGSGMDPEHIDKIFAPYFSTRDPGRGTGLGLFITKKVVEIHSGEIDVVSEPGAGTTVTIELPVTANQLATAAS